VLVILDVPWRMKTHTEDPAGERVIVQRSVRCLCCVQPTPEFCIFAESFFTFSIHWEWYNIQDGDTAGVTSRNFARE